MSGRTVGVDHKNGTVLETAGRASDMLKRLPGVKGYEDGVEIFGRGTAEVYINGRKIGDGLSLRNNQSFRYEYGGGAYNQLNVNYRKGGMDISAMLMGNIKNDGSGAS